jgi:hypothetical protein
VLGRRRRVGGQPHGAVHVERDDHVRASCRAGQLRPVGEHPSWASGGRLDATDHARGLRRVRRDEIRPQRCPAARGSGVDDQQRDPRAQPLQCRPQLRAHPAEVVVGDEHGVGGLGERRFQGRHQRGGGARQGRVRRPGVVAGERLAR